MKVYVLLSGTYSERDVDGVYVSLEAAKNSINREDNWSAYNEGEAYATWSFAGKTDPLEAYDIQEYEMEIADAS